MTAMTNAPPLPDEPDCLKEFRDGFATCSDGNDILTYIDTLRAQLKQAEVELAEQKNYAGELWLKISDKNAELEAATARADANERDAKQLRAAMEYLEISTRYEGQWAFAAINHFIKVALIDAALSGAPT